MIHTLTFEMPNTYMPPLGTPLYWRDEVTGILGAAMWAYIHHVAEPKTAPAPTQQQLELVVAYLRYVINAPCWRGPGLKQLRADAAALKTVAEVRAWVRRAVDMGIDPL